MRYTSAQYAKALYDLVEAEPRHTKKIVREFASTVVRHGRSPLLRAIIAEFEREWYTRQGIIPVTVEATVKHPVSHAELKKLVGTEVEVTEKIEPNLGGGVRITIGDFRIDNTLKRRISDLKNAIQKF